MAQTFAFSLVSPEREIFAGDVNSVSVPGVEGVFEVLANHSPLMSTLSPGFLEIVEGGASRKIYVRGGFADVTPAGLTVLAELAVAEDDLAGDIVENERAEADTVLADPHSTPEDELNARRALDILPSA